MFVFGPKARVGFMLKEVCTLERGERGCTWVARCVCVPPAGQFIRGEPRIMAYGGVVDKNPPAHAGDTGSISGLG